jgi:hypothetical protein
VLAQVSQGHAWGQFAADQPGGGLREQHLAAVGSRHQSGGAVDRRAVIVAIPLLADASVQTHARQQRPGQRPGLSYEGVLGGERGADGVRCPREGGVESIAGRLDDLSIVRKHRAAQDRIMSCQRRAHRRGLLLPQPGLPLEVGEEERDCARERVRHGGAESTCH